MNTSFASGVNRRKFAAAIVGVAAATAVAVPGVAWAQSAGQGASAAVENSEATTPFGECGEVLEALPESGGTTTLDGMSRLDVAGVAPITTTIGALPEVADTAALEGATQLDVAGVRPC